jgi:hypothetical protein
MPRINKNGINQTCSKIQWGKALKFSFNSRDANFFPELILLPTFTGFFFLLAAQNHI